MNDKKTLNDALDAVGLTAQAKVIWIQHPLLALIANKFALYVGPYAQTENGQSLLQEALKEAFAYCKEDADIPHEQLPSHFARVLRDRGREIFAQDLVVDVNGTEYGWVPFVCGAVEFVNKFPGATVTNKRVESRISDEVALGFVLLKILPESMLTQDALGELFNDLKAPA
jgi:hypothetical protein